MIDFHVHIHWLKVLLWIVGIWAVLGILYFFACMGNWFNIRY